MSHPLCSHTIPYPARCGPASCARRIAPPCAFSAPPSRSDLLRRRDNPRHRPPRSDVGDVPCGSERREVSRRACASECGRLDHSHFAPRPVPGTLSPLPPSSRSVATARVHLLSLSHRGPLAPAIALRYCHTGLFPPRRHRSFLPLSPPHSNVPTVYPPSIRASAHSPSISSFTSNRPRCACERIAKGE